MKKMLTCAFLLFCFFANPCAAFGQSETASGEMIQNSGIDDLFGALPSEAERILDQYDLNNGEKFLAPLSSKNIFRMIFDVAKASLAENFAPIMGMIAICLLCACIKAMTSDFLSSSIKGAIDFVSVLVCLQVVLLPTISMFKEVYLVLKDSNVFFSAFIPVYGTAAISAGQPVTGSVYMGMLMGASQVITSLCTNQFIPILAVFLTLSVGGTIYKNFSVSSVMSTVKKTFLILLSVTLILFNGVLSLQTFVSKPADTVALKAGKLLVSSAIPVVGGAVSDAVSTVYSSLSLLKSAIGVFGILAICVIFLPILTQCILYRISMGLCKIISGLFGERTLDDCLSSVGNCIDIVIAIIAAFICLFIAAILVLITAGGAI